MKKMTIGWILFLLVIALIAIFFIWRGSVSFLQDTEYKILATLVVTAVALFLSHFHQLTALILNKLIALRHRLEDKSEVTTTSEEQPDPDDAFYDLKSQLRHRYGPFWRRKLRWILVVGEEADVDLVAPGLRSDAWQIGNDALLIWGGTTKAALDDAWLKQLKRLRRVRPVDAQVWVVKADDYAPSKDKKAQQDKALWQMHARNQQLGYAAPLYLLDLRTTAWDQSDREEQAVGTLFPARATPDELAKRLASVSQSATDEGMAQVMVNNRHAFLLQLAQDLEQRDVPRLKGWLPQLLTAQGANPLRGLMFTCAVARPDTVADRAFVPTPAWQAIVDDSRIAKGRGVGVPWMRGLNVAVLTAIALFGAGSVVSYIGNVGLISSAKDLAADANDFSADMTTRLTRQQVLKQQMTQLQHRMQHGSPWYLRFGLNANDALLSALWPSYRIANEQNVQSVVVASLSGSLERLVQMPPNSPERAQLAKDGYDRLKAYLMLSRPDRVDAPLLGKTLIANAGPAPAAVTEGVWQSVGAELMQFYADNLSRHPDWAIKPDRRLINDVRQVLINQIGMQNAETAIYQGILKRVAQNYGNLTLNQVLNGLDGRALFHTEEEVPGMFTREAWEGMVEKEIEKAVKNRREEIDWVLTDSGKSLGGEIAPEALKARLTDRYFTDYGAAWLNFLNGISWERAESISDVIDQLTLMADARQSPLIALMNTVKYQGQTAQKGRGLSETLVQSAQEVFGAKAKRLDAIPMDTDEPTGPLDGTFGPLLRIVQSGAKGEGDNLSLQTYLTRVTRVRLKLQQITTAPDPQAMTQALAKTVFEGKAIDLTDTRDYGSLIAASLGEEWAGFGNSLFVQPLEQAWQGVLEPAAMSFNSAWRESIADPWYRTFNGRYPFKATGNDASLPELGRFLRPDSGMIERFVTTQLGGILHKQGDLWVADALNSQGLTFNPQFIAALNQLSRVSGILYASGDAKMSFELMARPSKDVVKTELLLDGESLVYFNQMEAWKTMTWPGDTYSPGAQLSWSTADAGQRLLDSPKGSWGWIRLLEQAKVTQIDSSRYRVTWRAEDGKNLTYILRAQSYSGPLELLKLRNFRLPASVFVTASSPASPPPTEPYAADDSTAGVGSKKPEKQGEPKIIGNPVSTADASTVRPPQKAKPAAEAESAQAQEGEATQEAAQETTATAGTSTPISGMIRIENDAH
ncbi:ImcF-related family protein [Leminorella grimontii]|uniref:ImcF-related family protein n=1 Tax=Leminorella grimontii TaxID=82981 RepID=UPI00208971AF|nr:ImcF-related family protein [Leminorella grimontii]GKX60738.1 type VI secretion protein VasK [Leminorella grimontii]